MASDLESKAKEAFIDDHFQLAVELYTQAIALNPNHAELYADRAQANIKLNNFTGTRLNLSFRDYCMILHWAWWFSFPRFVCYC